MSPREPGLDDVTALQPHAPGYSGETERSAPRVQWTDADGSHERTLERRTVIGSGSGVDLVVRDSAVSRLHAEFDLRDDGFWIRDLGSRNGTFVEGVRVGSAAVPASARIRLGSTTLSVLSSPGTTRVEVWPGEQFGPLIGRSVVMRELFARLARLAATDASVLVMGETGTGKELVARALHDSSPRASQPFVVVDCAALPENLLESELFGHARGSFTGAVASRAGAFETADGGTVFLDEIGELPLPMQPKLLRAIESRMVRRVGETHYRKVDVRFVSATHRDLRAMVNAGAFREDLYFRLAVVPVNLPALRERPEDIPALLEHFVPPGRDDLLTPDLVAELLRRPWLGNVRELRNFGDRLVALGPVDALQLSSDRALSAGPRTPATAAGAAATAASTLPGVPLDEPFKEIRDRWLDHLEREYVRGLLERHGGNVTAVAQAAGLDRTYVHRLMRKHDL